MNGKVKSGSKDIEMVNFFKKDDVKKEVKKCQLIPKWPWEWCKNWIVQITLMNIDCQGRDEYIGNIQKTMALNDKYKHSHQKVLKEYFGNQLKIRAPKIPQGSQNIISYNL